MFALENVKSLQTCINTICYQPFLSLKKATQIRFTQAYSILFMESFEMASIHNGAGIWLTSSLSDTMAGYPETQPRNGVRYLQAHSKHSPHRRTWRPDWNPLTPLCSRRTVGNKTSSKLLPLHGNPSLCAKRRLFTRARIAIIPPLLHLLSLILM